MRIDLTILTVGLLCLSMGVEAAERPPIQPDILLLQEALDHPEPPGFYLNTNLLPLWKQAIQQPESEIQRQVALAVVRAHQEGYSNLEQFRPDFLRLLSQAGVHPNTRYQAAHALIALDTRDSATALFELSQTDSQDFRLLIEPALSRWEFAAIRPVWRERLKTSGTGRRDLLLAVNGLAAAKDREVVSDLVAIAQDVLRPADVRIGAATGVSQLTGDGLEAAAQELLARAGNSRVERLCAVHLLRSHKSEAAVKIQQTLAVDPEPSVAVLALQSLFDNDPALVLPVAEASLTNRDAPVRRMAIEAYLRLPTVERLRTLSRHFNDLHPELRALVREGFLTYSSDPQFQPVILETTTAALAGDNWRGQEQSALLLAVLDRKEVAMRLVELLKSDRDEVMIATSWALRKLAVPETAPGMTEQLLTHTRTVNIEQEGATHQIIHLSEALGLLRYQPALPVMGKYIPKTDQYHPMARGAAVRAIGMVLEDAGVTGAPSDRTLAAEYSSQLIDRLKDYTSSNPERPHVRRACALALGRMKMATYVPDMKSMVGSECSLDRVDLAMRWAIHRVTDEWIPFRQFEAQEHTGWFLEPERKPIQ